MKTVVWPTICPQCQNLFETISNSSFDLMFLEDSEAHEVVCTVLIRARSVSRKFASSYGILVVSGCLG